MKLKHIIDDFGDTQKDVARFLGINESTLSLKLSGKYDFKQSEIKALVERYGLEAEQIQKVFFGGE